MGKPADDVFALGVTAWRLVTGGYPPSPEPQMDEKGSLRMVPLYLPPPHALNPQVNPQLSALILRMLSLAPEARGTAGELAEALEAAAAGPEPEVEVPAEGPVEAVRARPQARGLSWRVGLGPAGVGVFLALGLIGAFLVLWAWWMVHVLPEGASAVEQAASRSGQPDAGPAQLGDTASADPPAPVREPSKQQAISQEQPPEPIPGQVRPNAKGQCPGRKQVPINGGCWVEYPAANAGECEQNGLVPFKNRCYGPALDSRRKPPPTSDLPQ
jgi:hypothetical protein